MTITVKTLDATTEGDYPALLDVTPTAMFNHSLKYRNFLRRILPSAQDCYFLAYRDGELVGALPTFSRNGPFGVVINSLPFYGSHGGLICRPGCDPEVRTALFCALKRHCAEIGATLSTVIESPLDGEREFYSSLQSEYLDDRIGQISELPAAPLETVEAELLALFHQKTRNLVRKGIKAGFDVSREGSRQAFESLHAMHQHNMGAIGGLAKPIEIFDAIATEFEYGQDYRIYLAHKDGEFASALLVFYFKDMVEYFTPATLEKYRGDQPLSLLIFSAMKDAIIERSARLWNWGGTWLSQNGVYHFKSRWGTKDFPYRYHITTHGNSFDVRSLSKSELTSGYPYFYTVPFCELNSV